MFSLHACITTLKLLFSMSVKSNCFGPSPYQQKRKLWSLWETLINLVETPEQTWHRGELPPAAMVTQERGEAAATVCREHGPPNVLQPWDSEGWKVPPGQQGLSMGSQLITAHYCPGKANQTTSTTDSACDKPGKAALRHPHSRLPSPGMTGEKLCFQEGTEKQQNRL